jgi:hypothetical protein
VLRAAGETETTQDNIQDWLKLDEGDPGFQLLTEEEISAAIFLLFISIRTPCVIKFFIYSFSKFLLLFRALSSLIRMNNPR